MSFVNVGGANEAWAQYDEREPTEAEKVANRDLVAMRQRIDHLRLRFNAPPIRAKPFSTLAGDDLDSKPYQVSHGAWSAISHAIDNVTAAYDMTVVKKSDDHYTVMTRPHAVYPMLRAAYENACRGLWLIGGATRAERVERRLRAQLTDAVMQDAVQGLLDPSQGKRYNNQLEKLKPIAQPLGISNGRLKSSVSYKEVVRGAAVALDLDPDQSEAIWRCLSGLTHGDFWAMLTVLEREEFAVSPDGNVVTFRTTSPTTAVGSFLKIAAATTENALQLFEARATDRFPTAGL